MGFSLKSITKPLSKITKGIGPVVIGVGVGAVTMNPYAGMAAYTAASGINKYEGGRKLKKYGREYEASQIALANEYAETVRGIGQQRLNAANAAAHMLGRQAHMLRAAAHQAKELAGKNAELVIDQGEETLRRTKKEHRQTEGTAKARMWASGFLGNKGSHKEFQSSLGKENRRQQKWIERAFKQQAEVVREGGDIEAAVLKAQATGVSAGAAQVAAEGVAAFQLANLDATNAIAQAQLSGDQFIRAGKSQMTAGLTDIAGGLVGGFPAIGGFAASSASTGAGSAASGTFGSARGSFGGRSWLPSPSGSRGAI